MADEEELNRLAGELQLQQSKGDAIRQQIQQMQGAVIEIGSAIDAIKNLKKAKSDTLVPVGAGTFISCPKPDTDKVVISIGANVMLQKKPDEAIKMLEERQANVAKAISTAQEDMVAVVREIERLTQRANLIAAEESANVRPSKG